MPYKINGVEITLQPTSGQWLPRKEKGIDGNSHKVYPPTREFELRWDLISVSEFYQLQDFFDALPVTGSYIVDLPKYKDTIWEFVSYTGCIIDEPEANPYFETYRLEAKLLITNIRT
jgi:hypothetical protein